MGVAMQVYVQIFNSVPLICMSALVTHKTSFSTMALELRSNVLKFNQYSFCSGLCWLSGLCALELLFEAVCSMTVMVLVYDRHGIRFVGQFVQNSYSQNLGCPHLSFISIISFLDDLRFIFYYVYSKAYLGNINISLINETIFKCFSIAYKTMSEQEACSQPYNLQKINSYNMQTTQKTKNKKRKQSIQVMAEELNREFSREET